MKTNKKKDESFNREVKIIFIIFMLSLIFIEVRGFYDRFTYSEDETNLTNSTENVSYFEIHNTSGMILATKLQEFDTLGINCGNNYTTKINSTFIGCVRK